MRTKNVARKYIALERANTSFAIIGWYILLERIHVGSARLQPLIRVAVDQSVMAPFIQTTVLLLLPKLEGHSLADCVAKMTRDWWSVFTTGLKVWPATQLLNFYFVPLNFRIMVVQTVALLWNTYLSWKINIDVSDEGSVANPSITNVAHDN